MAPIKKTPAKPKRTRRSVNLSINPDLVIWATEYAALKHGWSLSQLVSTRLARLRRETEKAARAA